MQYDSLDDVRVAVDLRVEPEAVKIEKVVVGARGGGGGRGGRVRVEEGSVAVVDEKLVVARAELRVGGAELAEEVLRGHAQVHAAVAAGKVHSTERVLRKSQYGQKRRAKEGEMNRK